MLLGTAIDLQAVDDDLVSLETSFKAWLHDCGTDQEHLHLLLPPGTAGAGPVRVKCDFQERLLDPSLLPSAAFHRSPSSMQDATGPFWMAAGHSPAPRRLRAVRALKAEGLCASVLFGLPLVIRPTSCWRLNWDELEANQHSFQALCHCLRSILGGLQVEPTYNPLSVTSHLYEVLRSSLGQPQPSRTQRVAERHLPRQPSSRQPQTKARAAVAPLRMAPLPASPGPLPLCSAEEEDFTDSPPP
ncbi:UNVERIFIED_CONTAM: hypothetical protein K2H54_002282 [Gekko kuhli]